VSAKINPLAGKAAPASMLANIPRLVTAYFAGKPDPAVPAQRVAFGTSGHRGSAFGERAEVRGLYPPTLNFVTSTLLCPPTWRRQ
jgi:hypothetical protein